MYVIYSDISAFRSTDYVRPRDRLLLADADAFQAYCYFLLGPHVALNGRGYFTNLDTRNNHAIEAAAIDAALSLLPDGVTVVVETDVTSFYAFNDCPESETAKTRDSWAKTRDRMMRKHMIFWRLYDHSKRLHITFQYIEPHRRNGLYHRCHHISNQLREAGMPNSKYPLHYPPGIYKIAESERDFMLTMELLRSLRKRSPDFNRLQDVLREERRLYLAATSSGCPEQPISPSTSESRSLILC